MNNFELDEQAKLLSDTYSSYALAKMYLLMKESCDELEEYCDELNAILCEED